MSVCIDLTVRYGAKSVQTQLNALSEVIRADIPLEVTGHILVSKEGKTERPLKVLKALRTFLIRCAQLHVHGHWAWRPQLKVIQDKCIEIILANPGPEEKRFGRLPPELHVHIRKFLPPWEIFTTNRVCKKWRSTTNEAAMAYINDGYQFHSLFPRANAPSIINWTNQPSLKHKIHYASFFQVHCDGRKGLDDPLFHKFTAYHTNLTHLHLNQADITGKGLQSLAHLPRLKTLDIGFAKVSVGDLMHFKNVPLLTNLEMAEVGLTAGSLEFLSHLPLLRHLCIRRNYYLEKEALSYLRLTPLLESLSICHCTQFEGDILRFLELVPHLRSLVLVGCSIAGDTLRNLKFVTKLQELDLTECKKLETFALTYLKNTPDLRFLNISECFQFHPRSFWYLRHVTRLERLSFRWCSLEADCLKYLYYTPHLQSLSMGFSTHYNSDSLKYLIHTPMLRHLDVLGCENLDESYIPENLAFVCVPFKNAHFRT